MHLLTPGGSDNVLLVTVGSGRPEPGTYRIDDYVATDANPRKGDFVGTVSVKNGILGASGFHSVKGKLHISTSTPEAVFGCIEFTARTFAGTQAVEVEGRFAAKNRDE